LSFELKAIFIVLGFVLLLVVLAFMFFAVQVNNKQNRILAEKELAEAKAEQEKLQAQLDYQNALNLDRQRIAEDMHDELGAGLSYIKLLSAELQKKQSDAEAIEESNNIGNQAAELNASMRDLVWLLNPGNDNINKFTIHVLTFMQTMMQVANIELHSSIRISTIPEIDMAGSVRKNLWLACKEVINNILKHAHCTSVAINASCNDNIFTITIHDNGRGFSPAANSGTGLQSIKNRMQAVNGSVKYTQENGTKVELSIPLL
jgi:two-component system, NarL family, sensor histidine kinase DesK